MKMDLKEIGWKPVDWIHLAQDRDRRSAGVEPSTSIKFSLVPTEQQ
jgi:hypothetical protein